MVGEKIVKFLRDPPVEMFQTARTKELCDVTLIGDDKVPVLAHRIILASTSSFFRKLLSSHQQSEVVVHVEGLTKPDIETLLTYIYRDSTNTEWKNGDMTRILEISRYLFMDFMEEKKDKSFLPIPKSHDSQDGKHKSEKKNVLLSDDYELSYFKTERLDYTQSTEDAEEELEDEPKPVLGSDLADFDPELFEKCVENFEQKIPVSASENLRLPHVSQEMKRMEEVGERYRRKRAKAGDKWIYNTYWSHEQELMINNSLETLVEEQPGGLMCKVCGKIKKRRTHMSAHLEIHLDSLRYICQYCGEVKRTSNAFRKHVNESHKVYVAGNE